MINPWTQAESYHGHFEKSQTVFPIGNLNIYKHSDYMRLHVYRIKMKYYSYNYIKTQKDSVLLVKFAKK